MGLCLFLLLEKLTHTGNLLNPADWKTHIPFKGHIPQGHIIGNITDALHYKTMSNHGEFFPHQILINGGFLNICLNWLVFYLLFVGQSLRGLLYGPFIREVPVNPQPSVLLKVIDTSSIIGKAILALHGSGHILLRRLFCLRQRLVIQPFIKAIFKVVVHHHLKRRLHALGIAVDVLHGEPFQFIRQGNIEFPHFGDLFPHVPSP